MQKNEISIAYFKALSGEGEELLHLCKTALKDKMVRGCSIKLLEQTEYCMRTALLSCFNCDVVIFDASIEDECNVQYAAALELMKHLDYVLIVSRTPTPFNFCGMRKGGAPEIIATGCTAYADSMTNKEIVDWILNTLGQSSLQLPRKNKLNISWPKFNRNAKQVWKIEKNMIEDSYDRMPSADSIFVSYLSRYSKYSREKRQNDLPYVEDLFGDITRASGMPANCIQYFPPGEISLEFMTAQRRFEIIGLTMPYLTGCKELWIYRTPDYDNSWWTYAEKIMIAMSFYDAMDKCPEIHVATPIKNGTREWRFEVRDIVSLEEKKAFLPELSEFQIRELNRIHSNSDPDTVAYEKVEQMRSMAKLPDAYLKVALRPSNRKMKKTFMNIIDSSDSNPEERKKAADDIGNIDRQIESIRSFAYSLDFWEKHVVECPVCRAKSKDRLDPERFMQLKIPYQYHVSQEEYQLIKKSTENNGIYQIKMPCGHTVSVKRSGHYYRWWTVSNDVPTGPKNKFLEKIDFLDFV